MPDDQNWIKWSRWHSIADEYGNIDNDRTSPTVKGYFHGYGINGLEGIRHEPEEETPIVSPKTKRFYTATVMAEQSRARTYPRDTKYTLKNVQEHTGIDETAQQLSDAMDFMEVSGADAVNFSGDARNTGIESADLVKNLYEKRPQFPRTFDKLNRAQFVAELLIKRRDANIPLTPRRRIR